MHRLCAPAARTLVALTMGCALALGALAQGTPPELPKGLFPGGAPPVPAAQEPASGKSAHVEVPAGIARDSLGRIEVPPLARVTDLAGALKPGEHASIESKLAAFEQARGSQIAVLLVPSTQPEPIEDFANRIGNTWKIGRAGIGDGLLMVVATQDRRARIEVFRALEGAIPDVAARQIIREQMAPRFAAGDFAGGISAGLDAIFKRIEAERLPTPSGIPHERVDAGAGLMAAIVPFVIIGAVVASVMRRIFGFPGAAITGVGAGAVAGFMLSSLISALSLVLR